MTKFDQMAEMVSNGMSEKDAMKRVVPNVDYDTAKANVDSAQATADKLEAKYVTNTMIEMIFGEVQEQYPDDIPSQFRKLATIKRDCSMWNLTNSETKLREQQTDVDFLREAYTKTYEAELAMAETATVEELNALKNELGDVLPEELSDLYDVVKENVSPEIADMMNELQADPKLAKNIQAKVALLATAAIMDEGGVTDEEAAKMGNAFAAMSVGNKKSWAASLLSVLGHGSAGALFVGICAKLAGYSALSFGLFNVGIALSIGFGAVVALYAALKLGKKVWPLVKPALQKVVDAWNHYVTPIVVKFAIKAKRAVKQICGFVEDKIFRPVVEWTKDTAIPFILNRVYHPMERRLKQLWSWMVEKKNQFIKFFHDAKAVADEKAAAYVASEAKKEAAPTRVDETSDEDDDEREHAYVY